jgi:hypothetical protein
VGVRGWAEWRARSCSDGPEKHDELQGAIPDALGGNSLEAIRMEFSIRRGALIVGISLVTAAGAPRLSAQAVLRGILYDDASGARLRGTVMLVDPATDAPVIHVSTDTLGQFTMQFRGGTFQVAAVRAGYKSVLSAPMALQNGERLTIRIPIAVDADPTHSIGVLEHVRPGDNKGDARKISMDGFDSRRRVGTGLHYDHAQLVRSQTRTLGEFLQNVPGLRIGDPTSANSTTVMRNQAMSLVSSMSGRSCQVAWFVDGHRLDIAGRSDAMTDALGSLTVDNIAGLEIFRGLSEIPSEFADPDIRCGAIAVWTRVG